MLVIAETTYKFVFEMKDKKTAYPFKVAAASEKEARAVLTDHMGQILDQIEIADRKEAEKERAVPSPAKVVLP